MKIIVLHGDDSEKSYARLVKFIREAKKRNWEIVNDKLEDTASLFGNEKLIIIRDYKSLAKKEFNLIDKIAGYLVIYNQGYILQTFLKRLPKDTKIEKFDLPKLIWNFLDTFSVKTLHEIVKTEPIELIFSLICSRIKELYWVKVGNPPYPTWRINKLKSQSRNFTNRDLESIISDLAEIDVKVKTSKANLLSSLDFLLIKKLSL